MSGAITLVVTDLDGSLLDHHDYSYAPALATLQLLEQLRIPVVFSSSKTRAEVLDLRQELGNEHPFIVENGAAVLVPQRYFLQQPDATSVLDEYWLHECAPNRDTWSAPLAHLRQQMPDSFIDFASAGDAGIARITGLPLEKARLANLREYSEPVQWLGNDANLQGFLDELASRGARVLRGGRFYTVTGDCDKGQAWQWLREQYALAAGGDAVYDLAVGDGGNDVPMLELSHRALRIPATGRPLPELARSVGIIDVEGTGPDAWAQGVRIWLQSLYKGF
ncbi:MAG: HAD-IIB family hydrolase [Congregibacter sp.]